MSFRGFAKAVARLPQQVKAKAGLSEETVDEEFDQLVSYFEQFKDFISKLKEDSQKFKKAMEAMLQHQRTFAATFLDVQAPITISGGSGAQSGSEADLLEVNQKIKRVSSDPATANAVQLYINSLDEIYTQIGQDLTVIDRRVVQPVNDLQAIFRNVDRAIVKRNHKLLDFDRHRNELQRVKSASGTKDEKRAVQAEAQVQTATREYGTVNDALKAQLPQFLQLRLEFIGPCFQTLYFLQMKIYAALLKSLDPLRQLQRYDFALPMLETYEKHRPHIDQLVDALTLLKPKAPTEPASPTATTATTETLLPPQPAPAIGAAPVGTVAASGAVPMALAPAGPPAAAPVPVPLGPAGTAPPPDPATASARYVVALYDFPGQQPDDLPFRVGDQILVLEATASTNDWWKGQLNGKVGYFPANYVKQ